MGKLSQSSQRAQSVKRRLQRRLRSSGQVGQGGSRRELRVVLERMDITPMLQRPRDTMTRASPQLYVSLERSDISTDRNQPLSSSQASSVLSSTSSQRSRRRRRLIVHDTLRRKGAFKRIMPTSQSSSQSDDLTVASQSSSQSDDPAVASQLSTSLSLPSSSVEFVRSPVRSPPVVDLPVVRPLDGDDEQQRPRRRHALIPHRVTYRHAIDADVETLEYVAEHSHLCGDFNDACEHCGAIFFTKELGKSRMCCNNGTIVLPPLQCPDDFKTLFTSNTRQTTQFLDNVRVVNSLFAMASFKTSTPARELQGQGHWCFSVCGQVYHYTTGVPATQDLANPMLSHYYFLDVEEVLNRRCSFLEGRVAPELIRKIEFMLRRHNRYVQAYETIGEVLEAERRRRNLPRSVNDIVIGFSRAGDMRQKTRQYDLPESRSEIAAVFNGTEPPFAVDLVLYPRAGPVTVGGTPARSQEMRHNEIKNLNPMADPLVYPLLFPCGEDGWSMDLRTAAGSKITMRQFYRYRIQRRQYQFSLLHHGGKLFQQYLVDAWVRVEGDILWWYKQNQNKFRLITRRVLANLAVNVPDAAQRVGRACTVLPSGFLGGPRHTQRQYLDAMAVVARHGKPDLFITFTCNPSWWAIDNTLQLRQKFEHRPDLVCRVFRMKLLEFMDDLVNKQLYGVVLNYHYVVEFQKRGLPHAHIVVTFVAEDKITTVEQVDRIIHATIPDPVTQPRLYELVSRHHVHRPCGVDYPDAPCMSGGRCKKFFPKQNCDQTVLGAGGDKRPIYKRPQDGRFIMFQNTIITNTRIVPYNPYALAKYQTHINFEIVGSIETMKYLFKYVSKGVDCITIVQGEQEEVRVDEIATYLDCRYVSAMEAAWRLLEFKMHDRSHAVVVMPVHLPDEDQLMCDTGHVSARDLRQRLNRSSKLEAWFHLNQTHAEARQYNYGEIPEHYVWNNKLTMWTRRVQKSKVMGAIAEVVPREHSLDLFYLRVLLKHIKGAVSYEDLRTYRGTTYDTFREACEARNLLIHADEFDRCLHEAVSLKHPAQLRRLFALIVCVIDGERLNEVKVLFHKYKIEMIQDYVRRGMGRREALNACLAFISDYLERNKPDYTCEELGITLNDDDLAVDVEEGHRDVVDMAVDHVVNDDDDDGDGQLRRPSYDPASLNVDQRRIFLSVVRAVARIAGKTLPNDLIDLVGGPGVDVDAIVARDDLQKPNLFYIDGPGGTGKTYLYNCLLRYLHSVLGLTTRSVAWTGIAANLLINGTTVHRSFRCPIGLTAQSTVGWALETRQSRAYRNVGLIVWDEAPMTHRHALEAVDRYLREVTGKRQMPMGGLCVVLGGDFRQVLPVVPRGHRASVIDASLKSTAIWRQFLTLKLSNNMRTSAPATTGAVVPAPPERLPELGDRSFAEWLLALGEGTLPYFTVQGQGHRMLNDLIEIPKLFHVDSVQALLSFVFGNNIEDYVAEDVGEKAILCPTNAMVNDINESILSKLQGDAVSYFSVDEIQGDVDRDELHVPLDVLNSINVPSLPPHELKLKVGAVVMLLRNLDVDRGECNGTRLRVVHLGEHIIKCALLSGERKGKTVLLPKFKMIARDTMIPQQVIRTQFPVRLAYAITINKAQGQTLSRVGVYLKRPCFSHGQLYVAFSRVRAVENVKVYIEDGELQGTFRNRGGKKYTSNVVYHSILQDAATDGQHVATAVTRGPVIQRPPVVVAPGAPVSVVTTAAPAAAADQRAAVEETSTTAGDRPFDWDDEDENDDIFEQLDVERAIRDWHGFRDDEILLDVPEDVFALDPYVDEEGQDLPIDFAPHRERQELEARVSVFDRPGTTGAALRRPSPPMQRNYSSSSDD